MLNANYITGLIDGEGSFTAYICNLKYLSRERKRRVRIEPKFYIKLIEEDKEILYGLKKFFGCGHVYFQKDNRPNHKNCYRYEVNKREDLMKVIVPFFKKCPVKLKSKARDFKIFCQILDEIKNEKHLTPEGLNKLYKLKQGMH